VRWGNAAVGAMAEAGTHEAIGEVNNGGDLVRLNVKAAWDRSAGQSQFRYTAVRASTSKKTRAEPVAALYEQRRIHHVGVHTELEHQMCTWVPPEERDEEHDTTITYEDGFTGSPDRVDALVWLATSLLIDPPEKGRGGLSLG
jgi:phage terminase large subunit-like protein